MIQGEIYIPSDRYLVKDREGARTLTRKLNETPEIK